MKVNMLTAADHVANHNGRLTVVDVFDNIELTECPAIFRAFGVAGKIMPESKDIGRTYTGLIRLRKSHCKGQLFAIKFNLDFRKLSKKKVNAVAIAMMIQGIRFEAYGEYKLTLSVEKRVIASTKIAVVKKSTGSPAAAKKKKKR